MDKRIHIIGICLFIFCFATVCFATVCFSQEQQNAEEILLKADEVRNPQLDYVVQVSVTSFKAKQDSRKSTFEVMVGGKDKTVIKTLSPPMEKGRVLLMRDRDLWAFLPDVSKPLRISLQERLLGEVANGDIARANFSGDYTPQIIKSETIEGREYYILELVAKTDEVTYARVVLWAEKESYHPLKAEFYAISGRLLKTCSYENYRELAGRLRPSRLIMSDPIVRGQYSTIDYDEMQIQELPEKYFTKDYMKKFME